jgi:hypothetical protein
MFNETQNKLLLEAVDLLQRADVLLQKAMGASDECYYIHSQIENASDDILDALRENNPEEVE